MRAILTLLLFIVPTAAYAHTGHADAGGLASGFAHPMAGLDHVLAMLAVGAFAAVLGGRALFLVPLSFVLMMVAGFAAGSAGIGLPYVELGIALSSIVIGAVAASGRSMPVAAAMSLVGAFALFHGQAHGAEMPVGASGLEFALGFVAATALLHAVGLGATLAVGKAVGKHGRAIARIGSGVFALGGVGLLAGWL